MNCEWDKSAVFFRDLKSFTDREVCCYMISCKNSTNIDRVMDWLLKHSKSKNWDDEFLSLGVDSRRFFIGHIPICWCEMRSWLTWLLIDLLSLVIRSSDFCLILCFFLFFWSFGRPLGLSWYFAPYRRAVRWFCWILSYWYSFVWSTLYFAYGKLAMNLFIQEILVLFVPPTYLYLFDQRLIWCPRSVVIF